MLKKYNYEHSLSLFIIIDGNIAYESLIIYFVFTKFNIHVVPHSRFCPVIAHYDQYYTSSAPRHNDKYTMSIWGSDTSDAHPYL